MWAEWKSGGRREEVRSLVPEAERATRCLFPCISSLDRCLLDDGIKEPFNMTSALVFFSLLFNKKMKKTPRTSLEVRSYCTQRAPCKATPCFTHSIQIIEVGGGGGGGGFERSFEQSCG